jgi:hypothetical protein
VLRRLSHDLAKRGLTSSLISSVAVEAARLGALAEAAARRIVTAGAARRSSPAPPPFRRHSWLRCTLFSVFRILFSQCHYVVTRRPAAVARYFRRGPGPAIYANPLCWARPIDAELRRDARTVTPTRIRRAAPKRWSAGRSGEGRVLSNRGRCR